MKIYKIEFTGHGFAECKALSVEVMDFQLLLTLVRIQPAH